MSVIEINHPLIEHKMTILRSVDTDTKSFRENLNEIAKLMTYEATKKLIIIVVNAPRNRIIIASHFGIMSALSHVYAF